MHFTKNIILWLREFSNVTLPSEWLNEVVPIVCWHKMALVGFLQEEEDVLSVNRNLKIFCETAPCTLNILKKTKQITLSQKA